MTYQKQEKTQGLYIKMHSSLAMLEEIKESIEHAINPDEINWADCAEIARVENLLAEILRRKDSKKV
jgi:hypothetical protein